MSFSHYRHLTKLYKNNRWVGKGVAVSLARSGKEGVRVEASFTPRASIMPRSFGRGSPAAGPFLLLAQKKEAKGKGTQLRCPAGSLASGFKPGDAETRFAMFG